MSLSHWLENLFSRPEPEPIEVFDVIVYRGPDRTPIEISNCRSIITKTNLEIHGINNALTIFREWEYITTSKWRPYVP